MEEKLEINKCCALCERATTLAGEDYILCSKKGVVAVTYVCRRFVYDPLKLIPKRPAKMPTLDEMTIDLPEL